MRLRGPRAPHVMVPGLLAEARRHAPDVGWRRWVATEMRSPADRFWEKVLVTASTQDCWEWTAYRDRDGYGRFRQNSERKVYAHRWAYSYLRGEIPAGLVIDHLCRNPPCVNPWHLEIVTVLENTRRGVALERSLAQKAARTHCKNGHAYTPDNIYRNPRMPNARMCRACIRSYVNAYVKRKKAA